MTPEREGRFSLWPSPRKRQRRTIRSFADAVVRRRAMQARVEVEVGFVDRGRPGAKDGSEVAAGGHAETSSRRGPHSRPALSLRIGVLAGRAVPVAHGKLEPPCVPRRRDGARPRRDGTHYPQPASLSRAAWPSRRRRLRVVNFRPAYAPHRIFVLREDDFRQEMMGTIAPQYWIAPALATSGDALEPMQSGSIKALGIQKPWAPPRSYGLIARIDEVATSSRACIAASAVVAMASPRLAKQRKVSSSSPKGMRCKVHGPGRPGEGLESAAAARGRPRLNNAFKRWTGQSSALARMGLSQLGAVEREEKRKDESAKPAQS
jgi:hypothetical protein